MAVLDSLQKLHSIGFVHCDIKPFNILMDNSDDEFAKFMLIDFGISKKYVDKNGQHVARTKRSRFRGSIEFTSNNCLKKYGKLSNVFSFIKSLLFSAFKKVRSRVIGLYPSLFASWTIGIQR